MINTYNISRTFENKSAMIVFFFNNGESGPAQFVDNYVNNDVYSENYRHIKAKSK